MQHHLFSHQNPDQQRSRFPATITLIIQKNVGSSFYILNPEKKELAYSVFIIGQHNQPASSIDLGL
jgi:hypothetical protein